MRLKNTVKTFLPVVLMAGVMACSHSKKNTTPLTPEEKAKSNQVLLERVCLQGAETQKVTGSLWMKTLADGKGGQFPATVRASAPDQVEMEVTNAFGGSEAWIEVKGNQYTIRLPEEKGQQPVTGKDNWRGIPLRWAADLFLGRIPCPDRKLRVGARLDQPKENTLEVVAGVDRFVYEGDFSNPEKPVVKTLRWEKAGQNVNFVFSGAQKWEVRSSLGEVKIKWVDRDSVESGL